MSQTGLERERSWMTASLDFMFNMATSGSYQHACPSWYTVSPDKPRVKISLSSFKNQNFLILWCINNINILHFPLGKYFHFPRGHLLHIPNEKCIYYNKMLEIHKTSLSVVQRHNKKLYSIYGRLLLDGGKTGWESPTHKVPELSVWPKFTMYVINIF